VYVHQEKYLPALEDTRDHPEVDDGEAEGEVEGALSPRYSPASPLFGPPSPSYTLTLPQDGPISPQ
jgi:hypothetical protein